jgi:hypothetical protein
MTMPVLENLKEYAERATGLGRPGKKNARHFTRSRKPTPSASRTTSPPAAIGPPAGIRCPAGCGSD